MREADGPAHHNAAGPILITGATGFVGRHVRAALLAPEIHGEHHTIEIRNVEILTPALDITDPSAVRALIDERRPACCLHLAAVAASGEARADPARAWAVNLHGTLHLAAAIRDLAPDCRLLFASSGEIYGESFRTATALDETALLAPVTPYAATKAAADLALGAMAAEGLGVIRLRAFNHTGPGQSEAFVVPAFARQIARIEAGLAPPVIAVGALDPERDFLDVRDVARAYVAAIRRAGSLPPGTILNIASGTPRRIGDILRALLDLCEVEVRIEEDRARLRPAEIPRALGDAGRAHDLLGWRPAIAWQDTLADVLNDWRARVRNEGA
jgi:GDP-4-dehydro-6-deoxy-D-mannose reductase